ncbi:MAG: hypothetical protein V4598_04670 [Bdellovibrionota bacterium]
MKVFIVSLLAFSMASAMAAEVQIMDAALPLINSNQSSATAKFQVDKTTGEGSVSVSVSEMRWTDFGGGYDQWGRWYPNRVNMPVVIFSDSVNVEGLSLHGDQVIYAGRDGDVNCGRLGQSSVLRRPTIYLTGNCKLTTKITGTWSTARLQVTMTTK